MFLEKFNKKSQSNLTQYLIKVLITVICSFFIIYSYYSYAYHNESFTGNSLYFILIGVIYLIYRSFYIIFGYKNITLTPFKIFSFFLGHLLILCICFFNLNDKDIGGSLILFFKIVGYIILPFSIIILSLSSGKKVLSYFIDLSSETKIYNFIINLGVGFFLFTFFLTIFGLLGFYDYITVLMILGAFLLFSFKEVIYYIKGIFQYKIIFEISKGYYLKLFSSEFLFFISTLVIGVGFINIIRPFPIGWDDLGAYMNIPNLLAYSGSLLGHSGMFTWQVLTGTGYLFDSTNQAFFLNNIGGIMSFILLTLIFSDLLKSNNKEKATFINIPLLLATIFISMPMVIFQQAKDMKLDTGLFFVSIIAIYLLLKLFIKKTKESDSELLIKKTKKSDSELFNKLFLKNQPTNKKRNTLIIIFIIGLISGLAFSIKITSLLLIVSIIAVVIYNSFGLIGFLGYLGLFFGIFTKFGLWTYMNVVYPKDDIGFINTASFIFIFTGFIIFGFFAKKDFKIFKELVLKISILLLGIILALSPWFIKNISSINNNISLSTLITGENDSSFAIDYNVLFSERELAELSESSGYGRGNTSSGTTKNEDFGRYFGYEEGINNYVKLPWNLTMQENQKGEFTDITYIFLALIPVLLLFLPYKKEYFSYGIIFLLLLELLLFVKVDNNIIENDYIKNLSEKSRITFFKANDNVFKVKNFNKDIYDINIFKYISKANINSLVTENESFEFLYNKITQSFYLELKDKVINHNLGKELKINNIFLEDTDFEFIKELRKLNTDYSIFKPEIDSISSLNKVIEKNRLIDDSKELEQLWRGHRTYNQLISDFFSKINLPNGYIIILIIFLLPLIYLNYLLKRNEKNALFLNNFIFVLLYVFLWAISSFGIVWYGISMYFGFLLIIGLGLYHMTIYSDGEELKIKQVRFFSSIIILLICSIYFLYSTIPHAFKNLKGTGYVDYKLGELNEEEAIFTYHNDYTKILSELNIKEDMQNELLMNNVSDDKIKEMILINKLDINGAIRLLDGLLNSKDVAFDTKITLKEDRSKIFKLLLKPTIEYKSDEIIYRIGTFLKYFISENNKRLFEDNLITNFNNYMYNVDSDTTVDNMKKLGLKFLLVDLNAATIDKDPRHDLTKRYENLLSTFRSDKIELIETDSICLKLALDEYSKSNKEEKDYLRYLLTSGVNHESYDNNGTAIPRGNKLYTCYSSIYKLINENKIDNSNHKYLLTFKNYINKNGINKEKEIYSALQQVYGHGYKALFKIK